MWDVYELPVRSLLSTCTSHVNHCQRCVRGCVVHLISESWPVRSNPRKGADMLTLTENATIAVKSLTEQLSTDTGGLRISEALAPEKGYALNLAHSPEPDDTVVEAGGARVFVDPVTSVALDTRVLDAQITDDGSVGFALADQR